MILKPRLIQAGLAASFLAFAAAEAANRLTVESRTIPLTTTGNSVAITADTDQEIYGFSLHMTFDGSKVHVTGMDAGTAIAGLSPEYFNGTFTQSPGRMIAGVVFDTSNPISKKLPIGAGQQILKLRVDAVAASATTALLDLANVTGTPSHLNVMTDLRGISVTPLLVDGTLTLSDFTPVIQSFTSNAGKPGRQFSIVGDHFDQAGLAVTVCGKPVTFTLLADKRTINTTAPDCTPGPAEVKVCTTFGCDSDPSGFVYDAPRPFVRGDVNNDTVLDLSDAVSILLYLFAGLQPLAPCADALDANDSGNIDLTDAIRILDYLYLEGPAVANPFPAAGLDATADSLPPC
jgi:hypothetical protein